MAKICSPKERRNTSGKKLQDSTCSPKFCFKQNPNSLCAPYLTTYHFQHQKVWHYYKIKSSLAFIIPPPLRKRQFHFLNSGILNQNCIYICKLKKTFNILHSTLTQHSSHVTIKIVIIIIFSVNLVVGTFSEESSVSLVLLYQ